MRLLAVALACCSLAAHAQNVLANRAPIRADAVPNPGRLTDGQAALDGEPWDGPTAVMVPQAASVEFDLDQPTQLSGAALQADNNDDYTLSVSDDGVTWREVWRGGPVDGSGLRTRSTTDLDVKARYVRLTASGGDTRYSVSELELFSGSTDGSVLLRERWVPRRPLEQAFTSWALGLALVLLLASRKLPKLALVLLGGGGLAYTLWLLSQVPMDPQALQSLPWIRAAIALVAIAAVVRERLFKAGWPAHPGFTVGALGVTGVLATWAFLNLGMPQFRDAGANRPTWLHHYDMRTYFPIAKYFPELRFDGVYAASVLAVAEGGPLERFDALPIRDLRNHQLTNVRDAKAHILSVRGRFSPERWNEFLVDMGYFRRAMSDGGFLGSMNDHGGNATPVWFLTARFLFANAPASDATLWRGELADIGLFLLAIALLWWAFGARTALLALTVFGAMDFYQFGSNWFGATLRHDWLSLWAIGLALLHKRKFALAGAAFAWSAWIRAFPALTFITLSFPVVFLSAKLLLQREKVKAREAMKPLWRVVLGVVIASVVLVGLSVVVFGADAWTEWLRKVATLDKDNHLNNISFRTYINSERWAWAVAVVGSLLALFVVLRRASLSRAAAWGVALVPIVFNPANYYMHSAFLLVVLAAEERGVVSLRGWLAWLAVLGMCVASYFTNVNPDMGVHFRQDTVVCFTTLAVLFALELGRPREPLET
ncbi:MAG: discoidin domain-containing protein [Myxococcaceae bacterium]